MGNDQHTHPLPWDPPGMPLFPAAGMHWPSSPCSGRVIFLGTAGCKGHCCPLLVQGLGERGQPRLHPGPGTPAGRDPAVPCCHTCTERARAQPGCHRLSKLTSFDPPCQQKPFWS